MKTPYKNIRNILGLNRFVVIAVVIASSAISAISMLLVLRLHNEAMNNAFMVNTEGNVIPLKLVDQKENLEVEAMAHLELFHNYFYNINPNNYEHNLEKALWLGNSSVDALYRQKRAEGVYNRLLQYSLVQKVLSIESKINLDSEPFAFETKTIFEINRGATKDTYELVSSGRLIRIERVFPNNTHGFLITDFFENTMRKLEQYEN
ncbi:conjugal transfer protein TraK [Arenibacter sp. BSSL-BM3]|uniref:Conjugal transfer protein TraK n=1 Tax=Arenibacter arenosicollis TaxID=2762274 RepID=A0ABR7QR81_9FLAO|nr:conjugal transfer protein TraK [Arenibacter arenosicollis]MBC8769673.1 conjugal transfer protein TraK [Arenibacter arenosicollis]